MFSRSIWSILLLMGLECLATASWGQQFNYAPNAVYFCRFQNKFDASIGVGIGRGPDMRSIEWQAAFSPVRHVALSVAYFDARNKKVLDQEAPGSSSRLGELGLGVYESVANGTASLFVGYGQGSVFSNYAYNREANFDLQRWFVQPAMIFRSRVFEWGLALRLTRLRYAHADIDYQIPSEDLYSVQAINKQSPFLLPELGLHGGLAFKAFSISLNTTSLFYDASTFNFNKVNTNVLLTLELDRLFQRKKQPNAD